VEPAISAPAITPNIATANDNAARVITLVNNWVNVVPPRTKNDYGISLSGIDRWLRNTDTGKQKRLGITHDTTQTNDETTLSGPKGRPAGVPIWSRTSSDPRLINDRDGFIERPSNRRVEPKIGTLRHSGDLIQAI
jgi:hypothetical protein